MSETNPIPVEAPKSRTPQADRLHDILAARFGTDWRSKINLTVLVRDFYWIIRLAEIGVETMTKEFRNEKGQLDASSSMSIVSWRADIEALVDQIEKAKVAKK